MYIIRKRFQFSAAHRLHSPHLSEEENHETYGKCGNPNGHGHNYVLEVAVCGEPDPRTGMLINFYDLKTLVNHRVIEPLDHSNLNKDVDFLNGVISTAENLARVIWEQLESGFPPNCRLYEISLAETEGNVAVYRKES